MSNILFDFIQIAIGNRKSLSATINDSDWLRLFEFYKSQDILGIGYTAVKKLHNQGLICPSSLEEQWRALVHKIEKQNEVINKACADISRQYKHDGFFTCILNSQGSLLNYPEELRMRRMPGDIDVWASPLCDISVAVQTGSNDVEYAVYNGFRAVREYVKMQHRINGYLATPIIRYNHIEAPKIDGTEVEVHFRPCYAHSPLRNWRMQRWFGEHADVCMKNKTHMGFAVPTASVNVVYQMCHLFSHYFDEGLGLRQLMDYYFALRVWHNDVMECKDLQSQGMWSEGLGTPIMSAQEVMAVLRSFGMGKFAAAVMWVLNEVFFKNEECLLELEMRNEKLGIERELFTHCQTKEEFIKLRKFPRINRELKEIGPQADEDGEQQLPAIGQQLSKKYYAPWMICEPNEKEGRKLMAEIMQGGNFGQYDTRDAGLKKGGMIKHGVWKLKRVMRLVRSYPEEALWEPVFRVYHLFWRMIHC